ncbi:hypothetical protein B0H13DRAFT_2274132 [Mycena leptocephala]|nr:hypothetical protein B0H13DRAFT_2274132 [Mycena leptocephala]
MVSLPSINFRDRFADQRLGAPQKHTPMDNNAMVSSLALPSLHVRSKIFPATANDCFMEEFFSSLLFVLALSVFAVASPAPSRDAEDALIARQNAGTVPSTSVLTVNAVFQILNVAVEAITPGIACCVPPGDMGADDQILAKLVEDTLDDANTALNTLVPKLGLDAVLTPLDGALTGLLTALETSLLPSVFALVGGVLIAVGGVIGGLLQSLGLAGLVSIYHSRLPAT